MDKICLGKVVKLHGYMGEMKISTQYDKDFDIKKIQFMYDENDNEYKVKRVFKYTNGVVAGLEGVDLNRSKSFIGKNLYVSRELAKNKILFEDLKGSTVTLENGKTVGKITDVQDYGSAEIIFIKTAKNELLVPNVNGLISSFDYKQKLLVVSKSKLCEVSDYENWHFDTLSRKFYATKREHNFACNKNAKTRNKYNKHSWLFKG